LVHHFTHQIEGALEQDLLAHVGVLEAREPLLLHDRLLKDLEGIDRLI